MNIKVEDRHVIDTLKYSGEFIGKALTDDAYQDGCEFFAKRLMTRINSLVEKLEGQKRQ